MIKLVVVCLAGVLWCGSASADERVVRDLEFANVDGHSLTLDLYLPEGGRKPPLVIWIHGGGWRSGDKSKCAIRWMTEHQVAVASISYRLTDKAIFPAQIHDCKAAVRWLRAHGETYGYTSEKLAVAGSSAGGMLAALMGTTGDVKALEGDVGTYPDESSRVDAVINFYGPTDFVLRSKTQPEKANKPGSVVHRLLGGGADKKTALAKLASAAHHVTSDDPPLLIFHGEKDPVVKPGQSRRIYEEYEKIDLPVELIMIPGAKHGGKLFFSPANRKKMMMFLNQHLMGK